MEPTKSGVSMPTSEATEKCPKCSLPLNSDHAHRTYEEHDACRNQELPQVKRVPSGPVCSKAGLWPYPCQGRLELQTSGTMKGVFLCEEHAFQANRPAPPSPEGVTLGTCADFPNTLHPKGTCDNCDMWSPEGQRSTTLTGKSRDEWVRHIDNLFAIAIPGEDIPEEALLYGWSGALTDEDRAWAKAQIAELPSPLPNTLSPQEEQIEALLKEICELRASVIELTNSASIWRNRAIGAEEEIREGGRGIDLRKGFER